ncbi:chain-length determining protein [Methylovulum psychrotolerans]|jgi:capsular polysaccharide transport system permease protein|uniref:chain-length determining protein n=1 Tax=Methylovulum psychrotolerans TaxID=1704499 RepID=UPI001BFF7AA4|nr:chain-length determining protein [Methylovulum psychrotolerans]MBT9096760.1 chain-length determining protein [Methylovulum psychrotolerans]MBT9099275.1 chain-length determining protein [Methylovulum psychrotolerans]
MKKTHKTGPLAALKKHPVLAAAVAGAVLAGGYWGFYASDLYISQAHVIIRSTEISSGQSFDLGSLLGAANSADRADQLLLRDYLLSVDMLKKLDARLHLREHYSAPEHDWFSRLGTRFNDTLEIEEFYDYYLGRVSVEFDDFAGVLVIQAQGYDPQTAQAITAALVDDGERFMNELAHNLAREQVSFLSKQVADIGQATLKSRQALLDYQNRHGLVSPQASTENRAGIVNALESQLATFQTTRSAMLGYLMPNAANIVELNLQIAALERQIAAEKAKLAAPEGKPLNSTVEEYQRLEMLASFNQDIYKTALTALEQGRFEASRTLKKMSVLQPPTLPEYPLEPRRIYNSAVSVLMILLAAGIVHLLAAIIRDHKD